MVASSAEGSIFISDASDHHSQTASGAVSSLSSTASTSTSLASSSATSPTLSLKPPIPAANAAGVGSTTVGDSDDTTAHGTGVHSFDTSLAAAEALAQLFPSTHRYNQSSISSAQPSLQSSSAHVHLPLSSFVTSARSNPSTHLAASTSPSPAALLLQKTLQLTSASVGGTPIQSPVSASAAGNGPAGGTFTPLVAGSGGEDEEIEVGLEIMGDEVAEQVSAYGDIRSNRNSDLADPAALLQQQQAAALEQYAQHLQLQQQQLRANARRTARSRTSTPRRAKSTSGNGADPTTPGETSSADASYEEKHSSKKYSVGRCPHGKSKGLCLDCHETGKGGSSICHHKKRRSQCIQCFDEGTGGSTICKHRKQKYACRQCYDEGASTSTSMCKHRRERTKCKQCYDEGSPASTSVCPHRKQR
ncbi:hypothetical protein DFJ73DRAFT_373054 [Zopfochytrium polystomum]|nr:hypothetical protein DFJ73DRAFT_373054 [Zopfochytrium polystomum]